jgi:hypothetical protein
MWMVALWLVTAPPVVDPAPLLEKRLRHGRVSFSACFDTASEEKLSHVLTGAEGVTVLRALGATTPPDPALRHLLLGCLLWRDANKDAAARADAITHLKHAAALSGEDLLVTNALGYLAVQSGRLPVEERTAAVAVARPAARAAYWVGLAHLEGEPRDLAAARRWLETAAKDGKDLEAVRMLASVCHAQGEDARALTLLQGLPQNGHVPSSRLLLGQLLLPTNAQKSAAVLAVLKEEQDAARASKQKDLLPRRDRVGRDDAGCALGRAQVALGQLDAAQQSFQEAHCWSEQARALLSQGNLWEAMILLEARGQGMEDRVLLLDVLGRLGHVQHRHQRLAAAHQTCTKRPQPACNALPGLPANAPPTTSQWDPKVLATLEARLASLPTNPLQQSEWEDTPSAVTPLDANITGLRVVHAASGAGGDAALGLSARVHPMGEVGTGGWWLALRPKGAALWGAPLWLGVADRAPYATGDDVRVVDITATTVTLRMLYAPLDVDSITHPPVRLKTREPPRRVRVVVDLARLTADQDGDGLTDVLEHKLLTRPDHADTDEDGTPDGVDPLPLQALGTTTDAQAAILQAVLDHLKARPVAAVVEPVRGVAPGGVQRPLAAGVLFLSAPAPLALRAPSQGQTVVLPTPLLEPYRAMFGPTSPLALGPILMRADGQEAFLSYNGGFYWGTLRVTRQADGTWVATRVSHMVS